MLMATLAHVIGDDEAFGLTLVGTRLGNLKIKKNSPTPSCIKPASEFDSGCEDMR